MIISTLEYHALFGNKAIEEVTEQDVIEKREKLKENKNDSNDSFYTWKEPSIVYDEYGNAKIGIVEKTGFENEGF